MEMRQFDVQYSKQQLLSIQMDKIKKKLNNSALGKTIARAPQPHSKSFFVEPTDFVVTSQQRESSVNRHNQKSGSTSKASSAKAPLPCNFVSTSVSRIQQHRRYCTRIGSDLHSSTIEKSMRVNKLMREVHHFSICVQQLRWLLTEGDKLMQGHLKQTQLISPQSSYTHDVGEIAKEFRSLVLRFGNIDKFNLKSIEEFLNSEKQYKGERFDTVGFLSLEDTRVARKKHSLYESLAFMKEKQETRQNSFAYPKNFSVPLKENVNKSNLSVHFQNIKLLPPKQGKEKEIEITTNPLHASVKEDLQEQFQREKQDLYSKLRAQQEQNQQLVGTVKILKDELQGKQNKISKYKVFSTRSVEHLGVILKRLVQNISKGEREFELLKMAQCLNDWEKMLEDELEDLRFNKLYVDSNAMNLQRTQKLEEIISLQYEINSLLGQRKFLQKHEFAKNNSVSNEQMNEFYHMLQIQAISLQQLCGH